MVSVRPGPETHTFSFQVSRNEGSVCLETWGRGRAARAGEGRAGEGRGGGQGRGGPASNQTKTQFLKKIIFIIEHIKKNYNLFKKKKENK
jgi:hypothetical protein